VPDDTAEPWDGRHLDPPAHVHVPVRGSALAGSAAATHAVFEFEFLLNEGSDREWVLNRDLDIVVPFVRCAGPSSWGVPVAAPEVVLFFKAGGGLSAAGMRAAGSLFRRRDEQDFFVLLPTLTGVQRRWLRESLARIRIDHPWLAHLGP
jgi:hypothetical protein